MTIHRLLSSAMRSNDDIGWAVHSLLLYPSMIYEVFIWDEYYPLFLVVWSSTAHRDDRHGRTMIACDAWQLKVKAPDVRPEYWPVAIHIRLACALRMIRYAFSCNICFQRSSRLASIQIRRQRPALYPYSSIDKTSELYSLIFVEKSMALFCHSIGSLVMAECAWAFWSMPPLRFVWILCIWTGPLLPVFSIHPCWQMVLA